MRAGDLNTGAVKLNQALKRLMLRWEEVREHWQDRVAEEFEKNHLEPLKPQVQTTLQRMRDLSTMLSSIDRRSDRLS